jgi:hypothetical protein
MRGIGMSSSAGNVIRIFLIELRVNKVSGIKLR